jgi:hypothetical protein
MRWRKTLPRVPPNGCIETPTPNSSHPIDVHSSQADRRSQGARIRSRPLFKRSAPLLGSQRDFLTKTSIVRTI